MTRPLIGLTGRSRRGADVKGFVSSMDGAPLDVHVEAYSRAVFEAGGLPVQLPAFADPQAYAGRLDGLLLTGGADIEPSRYGAAPDPALGGVEPARDAFELGLVDTAVADGTPILGICRGAQLLNVWAGGTLHQHVPGHALWNQDPRLIVDEVTFVPGSRLHDMYGDRHAINSLHHQTIDRLADGWVATGHGRDGVIEALEWPDHDVLAVQWHPEMLAEPADDPIFAWLVERAAAHAAGLEVVGQ